MGTWTQAERERLTRGEVRGVYQATGWIMDEAGMIQPVLSSSSDVANIGDNEIIPAPGVGKIIRALAADLHCSGAAVGCRFRSATTAISGLLSFAVNAGRSLPYNQHGWFETAANQALNLNLSTGLGNIGVTVVYVVLDD